MSPTPRDRFFVEGVHAAGDVVPLGRDDAHKVIDVLRKSTGDRIVAIDSAAQAFTAVVEIDGRSVRVLLEEATATDVESAREIVLAQAIPKGQKMDYVVEKATELGIARLIPVESSRSIAGASANKLERWRHLARSAAQQSGRTRVPVVEEPVTFAVLLERIASFDCALFAWELARAPLRATLAEHAAAQTILGIVGPEGGFSHDEADSAEAAGAVPVSLGRRILRAETAPLVLVTAILYEGGEL